MEKKKWPWKRKSSERSPVESENSGSSSVSLSSGKDCDEQQDSSRELALQSPEVRSQALFQEDKMDDTAKCLLEKLSAALVNVSAKEELVKQHAKVAEEAVAGWEKSEKQVSALKQQLDTTLQQNVNLEARASHLDAALKECVRKLRQAREEHEKDISDVVMEKKRVWDNEKADLEKQVLELQAKVSKTAVDPKSSLIIETLGKENAFLKRELVSCYKELDVVTYERDLSIQAAETASKLQLEAIKKVAKLEAECRRYQLVWRKLPLPNNKRSASASYFYADSLTDSQSDCGERANTVDTETNVELNASEQNSADMWASALIAELDQFKNEKLSSESRLGIDMMDDFLEMERLAALPDTKSNTPNLSLSGSPCGESVSADNPLRPESDLIVHRVSELEKKLENVEMERTQLETALIESQGCLAEARSELEELQNALTTANEKKQLVESQPYLVATEHDAAGAISANADVMLETGSKQNSPTKLKVDTQELEDEVRKAEESVTQQKENSNTEPEFKEDDHLFAAADKLAECQRTIASLGKQLKSLATLEDFLIDTSNLPGFSRSPRDKFSHQESDIQERPSESATPVSHVTTAKTLNSLQKVLARSKSD